MKLIDVTQYESRIESGNYMVTALEISLEKFKVTIHLLEDDSSKIQSLKKDLSNFPYILNTTSVTVKVTESNFDSLKEYRYNPNK